MKRIVFLCLIFGGLANAYECNVKSHYQELEDGVNKKVICQDTMAALLYDTHLDIDAYKATLNIEAYGSRGMYYVALTKIELILDGDVDFLGSGSMNWYPGDSYVTLNE